MNPTREHWLRDHWQLALAGVSLAGVSATASALGAGAAVTDHEHPELVTAAHYAEHRIELSGRLASIEAKLDLLLEDSR